MDTETNETPYRLRIMPMAEEDLDGIFDYITNNLEALVAANRLMEKIEKAIRGLKDIPRIGPKCRDETFNVNSSAASPGCP
jgi:plasmid stabilization system protein ParE